MERCLPVVLLDTECALKFTTECENMTDPARDTGDEVVATGRRQTNAMRTVNKTQKLMSHWWPMVCV